MEVDKASLFGILIKQESNHRIHLSVQGSIDSLTIMDFDYCVNDSLQRGAVWILVDLSLVDSVSSVGVMRLLMARRQALKAGGDLVVQGAKPQVVEAFQHHGLNVQIVFVATQEEGWKLLSGKAS